MINDIQQTEKAYSSKDIALMVDIAVPTVRKYAQALEKAGYEFIKSEAGARVFVERDAMAIRYLKEVREKTNISVEQASNVVLTRFENKPIQGVAPPDTEEKEQYEKRFEELEKKLEQQNEIIKQLAQTIDERDKKRDEIVMQNIREIQETKQLLLETAAEKEEEKKRGFFARLFGK